MMKVINAAMKCPTLNIWFKTAASSVARSAMPGKAKPIMGMIRSVTIACTSAPKYKPRMKATASPMTLYFERKSMNSARIPFGGGGGGAGLGSSSSRIRLSSSSIFSSFDIF